MSSQKSLPLVVTVLLSLAALIGLLSCGNPLAGVSPGGQTGSLLLQLSSGSGPRLIAPTISMEVVLYQVQGFGPNGASFLRETSGGNVEVDSLVVGTWSIQVRGYNGTDPATRVFIGYGEAGAAVHAGVSTAVSVTVTPLPGPGLQFSLQVNWPADQVENPQAWGKLVHHVTGAEQTLNFTMTSGQATATVDNPPSGYYTLFFQLKEGGQLVVGKVDVVRIVEGQVTAGVWTFSQINRPTGSIQLEISPQMQQPLGVSLSAGEAVTVAPGGSLTVTATVAGLSAGQYGVAWYLDGGAVELGTGSSYTYTAPGASGYHHLDVVAFSLDGSNRAGSASLLITVAATLPSAQRALWARTQTGGSGYSQFASVAVDGPGNTYAAGAVLAGSAGFGNGVTATGAFSGYGGNPLLVMYDASGTALWARSVTAAGDYSYYSSVAADGSGNVYVVGSINGNGEFGFGNGVRATGSSGQHNPVLVKYGPTGTALWARTTSEGGGYAEFAEVAVDSSGNVYAAGYIGVGEWKFGEGVTAVGSSGGYNVVLVKYDAEGTALWARTVTGTVYASAFWSVAVDGSGNVYACGSIRGTNPFDFGGVTATGSSSVNPVVVKYSSSGTAQWARTVLGAAAPTIYDPSEFYAVKTDRAGNVYAVGDMNGTGPYDFGDGITATGSSLDNNPVVVKYTSSGAAQWARTATGSANRAEFYAVGVDASGTVYAGGQVSGTGEAVFGDGVTVTGTSIGYNMLLVAYSSSSGAAQWARTATGTGGGSLLYGAAVDGSNNLYTAGTIWGGAFSFGDDVTAAGVSSSDNALLVKYGH